MTGQEALIQIINKLSNCCSYATVLKAETAKAELSKDLSQQKIPLPLKPDQPGKHVLTYFWWDNFNCKKENLKGSIHTTHGIVCQEKSKHSTSVRSVNSITHSGKKSRHIILPLVKTNPKSPLTRIPCDVVIQNEKRDGHFQQILALWKLERGIHSDVNQIIPTFVGRVIQLFGIETFQTVLTFLPPITCPIAEFSTACETIHRPTHLSKISNMKYTHITVDVDAAEK